MIAIEIAIKVKGKMAMALFLHFVPKYFSKFASLNVCVYVVFLINVSFLIFSW